MGNALGYSQGLIQLGSRWEDRAVLLPLSHASHYWGGLQLPWPFTRIPFPDEDDLTISKAGCQGRGIAYQKYMWLIFLQVQSSAARLSAVCCVERAWACCTALQASFGRGCCERATKCCRQGVLWDSVPSIALSGLWDTPLASHPNTEIGTAVPGDMYLKHLGELQARSLKV